MREAVPVSPSDTANEDVLISASSVSSNHVTTKDDNKNQYGQVNGSNMSNVVEGADEDFVHDIEKGEYRESHLDSSMKSPVRPKTTGFIDLNHDGKDDFEQFGQFLNDLNGNGIDDAEEILELVDEYLPDAAGMLDILDWLTIAIVAVSIYMRLDYIRKASELHEFFVELGDEGNYDESMTIFIESFAEIDENVKVMNILVMFLIFFGLIQFFRYLSFDKRLGIVTSTIKESLGSLLPVLIIFLVVLFAYSVLGTVMYGAQLNTWSNVGKSVSQLFLLILGEFGSYFDIMEINPALSAIFFWSYITMALFLLFNMVLAVIFTVYENKNSEISAMEEKEREKEKERKRKIELRKEWQKEKETKKVK